MPHAKLAEFAKDRLLLINLYNPLQQTNNQ